jgi:hypothetical protein
VVNEGIMIHGKGNTRFFFLTVFTIISLVKLPLVFTEEIFDKFDFSVNIVDFGFGSNICNNNRSYELSLSMGSLFFSHRPSRMGVEINFLRASIWYYENAVNNIDKLLFLNLRPYFNLVQKRNIVLRIFTGINYFILNNPIDKMISGSDSKRKIYMDMHECIFNAGIGFYWTIGRELFLFPFLKTVRLEAGYRLGYDYQGLYMGINIEVPWEKL